MYHTPFQTNYTALTESGADWVVKHGIKFVGIDYLSIATYEELAPAHQSLMRVVSALLLHMGICAAMQSGCSLHSGCTLCLLAWLLALASCGTSHCLTCKACVKHLSSKICKPVMVHDPLISYGPIQSLHNSIAVFTKYSAAWVLILGRSRGTSARLAKASFAF